MKHKFILPTCLSLLLFGQSQAALINVDNYVYTTTPGGAYPDTLGIELTDGTTQTIVWGGGNSPTLGDVAPLVGWFNADPGIRFNFNSTETVQSITIWMADSDDGAGVNLPTQVTISDPNSAFTQTIAVTNPAGAGQMVPITLSGFSVDTDALIIEATPVAANKWTMFSEVTFDSVPEPSSVSLLGLAGLGFMLRRKR